MATGQLSLQNDMGTNRNEHENHISLNYDMRHVQNQLDKRKHVNNIWQWQELYSPSTYKLYAGML